MPSTKSLVMNKHLIDENVSIMTEMPSSNNFGQQKSTTLRWL